MLSLLVTIRYGGTLMVSDDKQEKLNVLSEQIAALAVKTYAKYWDITRQVLLGRHYIKRRCLLRYLPLKTGVENLRFQ
jgi:hypothetical protein